MSAERLSPCLPPDRINDLVVELERHGIDSGRIDVVSQPPRSVREMSEVDQATFARPVGRAALGFALGAVVGAIVGGLLIWAGMATGTLLGTVIAGAVFGALFGLYRRLPVSTDVADADSHPDDESMVRVNVNGMDRSVVDEIERILGVA